MLDSDYSEKLIRFANDENIDLGTVLETIVRETYEDILRPGDRAIDIGAHKGSHLLPMADCVGKKGRLHGFEAVPEFVRRLRKRSRKLGYRNIILYSMALGQTSGTSVFTFFEKYPAFSGIRRRETPFDDHEGARQDLNIRAERLDTILPVTTKIDFIKADIEGGEYDALKGAERLLRNSQPVIVFESGGYMSAEVYNYDHRAFFDYLTGLGYQIFNLAGRQIDAYNWNHPGPIWEYIAIPEQGSDNHVACMNKRLGRYCDQAMKRLKAVGSKASPATAYI